MQNTVGDNGAFRCDVSGAMPASDRVTLGVGGAVVNSDSRTDFDARGTDAARLGRSERAAGGVGGWRGAE